MYSSYISVAQSIAYPAFVVVVVLGGGVIATISVVIIIIASGYWYTKTKSNGRKRHLGNLCYGLYLPTI